MSERFGLYFAPAVTSELWRRGSIWLGRDALTGAAIEADIGGIDPEHRHALTRSARRYGFHATLKAPMELAARLEAKDLDRALKAWTARQAPIDIGPPILTWLDGFLALVLATPSPALSDFAAKVVIDFDGFRAPLTPAEHTRRQGAHLTPRQNELIEQFGYPYVLEQFLFHMTLTDRLEARDRESFFQAADSFFAPLLDERLLLDRLVLFHEAEPGAPFTRLRDYPLGGDAS